MIIKFNMTTGSSIHKKQNLCQLRIKHIHIYTQLNGINCPTPSGKRTTIINFKKLLKTLFLIRHIINSSHVKHLS